MKAALANERFDQRNFTIEFLLVERSSRIYHMVFGQEVFKRLDEKDLGDSSEIMRQFQQRGLLLSSKTVEEMHADETRRLEKN